MRDDEDEDNEHPDASMPCHQLHIQKKIMSRLDCRLEAAVRQSMWDRADAPRLNRIADIQHRDQDHSWLWALSPHKGPVMENEAYVEALRLRLGIAGPSEAVHCGLCRVIPNEGAGAHALCCARAESTKGHNSVCRQLFDEVRAVDPAAELEPIGLIPGTLLRPTDVLTGALGNGLVALDIGIASPDAAGAGEDCLQTMVDRKVDKYEPHREALQRQNIEYAPLVFSCFGRLHPNTTAILRTLAQRIARRRGCSAGEWTFRRLKAKLTMHV